jgi:ubiquitin-protein ligase
MFEKRLKTELNELRSLFKEDNSIRNVIANEDNIQECKLTVLPSEKESYDIQIYIPVID